MQHCRPTTPNIVRCYRLRPFAHPVACFWELLRSLKLVKLLIKQTTSNISFVRNHGRVAQQCCTGLHNSSNIVGATHAHYIWSLMGHILPIMHCVSSHCCKLLHPFTHHCQQHPTSARSTNRNNVGRCCVRLHVTL